MNNKVIERHWTEDDILTDIKVEAQENWIKQEITEPCIGRDDELQLIPFEVDDLFEDCMCRPKHGEQQNTSVMVNPPAVNIKHKHISFSAIEEVERYSNLEQCLKSRAKMMVDIEEDQNCKHGNDSFESIFIKSEVEKEETDSASCREDLFNHGCLSHSYEKQLFIRLMRVNIDLFLEKPSQSVKSSEASGKHVCHICPYSSISMYRYKRHIATHMSFEQYAKISPLYECNDCNYKTKQKYSLKRHLVQVHKSAYVCQNCNYETNSTDSFSLHLVSHHDNVLMYNCEKCDVSCCTKEQLKYHTKVHNLDHIILKCNECCFETKEMRCLDKHVLSHMHMRVGKLYKCEFCHYEAKKRSSISRHVLTHEKAKKFQCNECGYKTKRKDSLAHHIRKHKSPK